MPQSQLTVMASLIAIAGTAFLLAGCGGSWPSGNSPSSPGDSGTTDQNVISLRTTIAGSAALANAANPPSKLLSVSYDVTGPGGFSKPGIDGGTGEVMTLVVPSSGWQGTWNVTCNLTYGKQDGSQGTKQSDLPCTKDWQLGPLLVWFELDGVPNKNTLEGVDLKLLCN